ncbi:MAG: hypothetical protein JXR07_11440 [Reichenbachiella sp.]
MNHKNTRHILLSLFLISAQLCLGYNEDYDSLAQEYYNSAEALMFEDPDSSIYFYNKSFNTYRNQNDTLKLIEVLVSLSELHAHNGNFGIAYDGYWDALLLADAIDHAGARASVYSGLGWLYILYEREDEVKRYFNESIKINKERIRTMNFNRQVLVDDYYALLTFYRKQKNTEMARIYADSCILANSVGNNTNPITVYLQAEIGYILYQEGQYQQSLDTLVVLNDYFDRNLHSYLVILHYFIGEVHQSLQNYEKSEQYYLSAIQAGIEHKSHSDIFPDIYLQYSKLLLKMKQYEKAYDMLKKSIELDQRNFDSRGTDNQRFLEIKDQFRIQKEEKEKFEQEQALLRFQQEKTISKLEITVLYVAVAFLFMMIFVTYRYFRIKYKAKKKLLYERRALEKEKSREVLDIKNKELTASALQVIQKEEMLADLKEDLIKLKSNPDANAINRLAKNINTSTSNNWKEFEARFVSVNKGFYTGLNKRFPKLSQGDQKICALIKLNFSSKDMAKLLGISVESVHTTRYRLRKKLDLDRKDNLEEFIASIG